MVYLYLFVFAMVIDLITHCVTLSAQAEVHEEGDGVFKCVVR